MHASIGLSIDGGRVNDVCGMSTRRLSESSKPGSRLVHVVFKDIVPCTQCIKSLIARITN